MRIGGLTVFGKTNMPKSRIIAWHNPRSLTWRWSLWLALKQPIRPKFFAMWKASGAHRYGRWGFPGLCDFGLSRDNNGWQWDCSLIFLRISFHQQPSMWP